MYKDEIMTNKVLIVAECDPGWFDANTDWRMWHHLARAFGAQLSFIPQDMPLTAGVGALRDRRIVLVDEEGEYKHTEYEWPERVALVFGRSGRRLRPMFPREDSIRIETPAPVSLFGVEAAAIVLAHQYESNCIDGC